MKKINYFLLTFLALPIVAQQNIEYKIAIIGDSGNTNSFTEVLKLIKRQKASLVLHAGDLGYDELNPDSPQKWNQQVNDTLGSQFPYFFVVGNHDIKQWYSLKTGYHEILKKRLNDSKLSCVPGQNNLRNLGIKTSCQFNDLLVVGSGVGTLESNHPAYIEDALVKNRDIPWKICLWHKNQRDMQPGDKTDEVGWEVYQNCQKYGAMILTGHEHSYGRTLTLTDIGNRNKGHGVTGLPDKINLGPSSTFVAVSGLAGRTMRPYDCEIHDDNTWWGSIVTSNYLKLNGTDTYGPFCQEERAPLKKNGVLFITLNYQNNNQQALGEFITTDDQILDSFIIQRQ